MDLLKQRQFLPLFLTQFLGAFNDSAFKLSILTLISYHLSRLQSQSEFYQALAGALFTIPFFLFSAIAGQLADKFDKARLTQLIKFTEIILMVLGSLALYRANITLMLIVLAGMGIHSAFFGPIKYAILMDHLPKCHLLEATGLIEASTFVAILLGTILGTLSIGDSPDRINYALLMINGVAVLGFISSLFIPSAPSHLVNYRVNLKIWQSTWQMLKNVKDNPPIYLAVLAISWFWLIGAITLTKLPDYTHFILMANTHVFALFLALFSLGIAGGSLAISRFLQDEITLRYVPLAMLMMSLFAFDIYWISPGKPADVTELLGLNAFLHSLVNWRISIDFFLFSFCAGLFIVPLYTFLQISSEETQRARTIAANNIYNSLTMVLGTLIVMIMLKLNLPIPLVFLILAISNAIAASILWLLLSLIKELN